MTTASTWDWNDGSGSSTNLYAMDPDIKHPYMAQFTVGIERELFKDTSLGVTYINRKWNNIIGRVRPGRRLRPASVYVVPTLDQTFTVYERTEDIARDHRLPHHQPREGRDSPGSSRTPTGNTEGIEVLFNKRFSNRWQLLASYVYGKAHGDHATTASATTSAGAGPQSDPNFWINAKGNLTNDPTHMIKIQGTYVLPFDISFTAYFRGITGDAWTTQFRTRRLQPGPGHLLRRAARLQPLPHAARSSTCGWRRSSPWPRSTASA